MRSVVACLVLLVHYSCGALAVGNTTVNCRVKERLSLLSLKRGFVDPYGCQNHTDCCTWNGVSCDSRTGHVDALDLSFCNLEGNIPPNLGYLSCLQTLRLQGNQLEGGIPKSLALCTLTVLDLSNNSLSGQLDDFVASFDHCANISLQTLYLSCNWFTGSVPIFSRFSFLEELYLSNNSLRGVITETHFSRLSQLEYLDLSLNNLEFKIRPDWIPPFQLLQINLRSCKLGPGFPNWLRTQKSAGYSLDISNAEISGMMPSWFWDFSFESMDLSQNQMTGEIRNFQLENGSPAESLDLSSNLFEGSIPSNLSRVGSALFLSNNKFTDASTFLCPNKTVALRILDLSNNQLSGVLPDCWKYFESLAFLDVANNRLYGEIPTSMGSLIYMRSLHLGSNKFSGEIPLSLNKCTELLVFDVENDFSGLVPRWIGDGLKKLSVLLLRSNMFFGSLPLNICNLPQLQILDLSMNNICGSLPKCPNHLFALKNQTNFDAMAWYVFSSDPFDRDGPPSYSIEDMATLVWKGKVSKYQSILRLVKSIDLSCNMLMGEIPSELMDLVELVGLNISRNMLSGQIPATIGQLKSLDFLDLSRNHLSGHIPSELSQVDRLSVMDLSHNNLSGEIPHGTQLQSFDPSAYEGNAHLCGAPLPKCPMSPTQDANLEEDEQIFDRGFFISSSIGFGTGFWGICSLIFLNKSFRYAYFRLMSGIHDKVYVIVAINMAKLRGWRRGST